MSCKEIDTGISKLKPCGVLSKKECFKWCIPVPSLRIAESRKMSTFFSFGPTNDARFYFMITSDKHFLDVTFPYSQFNLYLCREWICGNISEHLKHDIKVTLAFLDVQNKLHHICEKVFQHDSGLVYSRVDLSCFNHRILLENSPLTIYCELDINETILEYDVLNDYLQKLSIFDEKSTLGLISDFSTLLKNGVHSDVTILVENASFNVHRAILSARSPVFAAMFKHDTVEKNENEVTINDVSIETISQLLHYIYTGQTNLLSVQAALPLFAASDKYNMPYLKQQCSVLLCSKITKDMLLNALIIANQHEDENVREAAIQGILDNAVEVLQSDEWLQFLREYPEVANNIVLQLAKKNFKKLTNNVL